VDNTEDLLLFTCIDIVQAGKRSPRLIIPDIILHHLVKIEGMEPGIKTYCFYRFKQQRHGRQSQVSQSYSWCAGLCKYTKIMKACERSIKRYSLYAVFCEPKGGI